MKRACGTCEWRQPGEVCAESNPWQTLPPARWCGRWRVAERLAGHPGGIEAAAEEEAQRVG